MNRRSFLKFLGVGAAAVAVAPALIHEAVVPAATQVEAPIVATIAGYYDYANFSSFAIAASIDECVANAAAELGRAHGERISRLVLA